MGLLSIKGSFFCFFIYNEDKSLLGGDFMNEQDSKRKEDMPLTKPNSQGNVWPKQTCPAFSPRGGALQNECWYCQFADFHLDKPRALEVGICYYPNKIFESSK